MLTIRTTARETLEYVDVAEPSPGPGEVIVRIAHVALCGTDLHIWEDDYASELPLVQGHELSGTIIEVAADVDSFAIGDAVVVDPLISCGDCSACRRGRANVCPRLTVLGCYTDGGLAEQVAVSTDRVHRVPSGVPLDLAAVAEPASIALQAVTRGRAVPEDVVLVLGAGPIGVLATIALVDLGATVIVADVLADRLELARAFGASGTVLVNPGETFPGAYGASLLDELTGGDGPGLVIEATGVPASLENALRSVAAGGRVVQVGISTRPAGFPMNLLAFTEVDLLGSRNSSGLIPRALTLIAAHPDKIRALITHRFEAEHLDRAFHTMRDRTQTVGKILIEMPTA